MDFVKLEKKDVIATLVLKRGKVNALNNNVVNQLRDSFKSLEHNPEIKAIIITGAERFFSFGFDIPEFLSFTKIQFAQYLKSFTDLYAYIFVYPKPVIAALNGHTVAGGCMLALACDYRVMVTERAKISLNEIGFGSTVFAGSTEMLRFWVGNAKATEILYSGNMYPAEEAKNLGLINEIASENNLMKVAYNAASVMASKNPQAFASIKLLLRKRVADEMIRCEEESIEEFVNIWYSEDTWENLKNIKIH